VIWGLCDAASAALFYAHQDARVTVWRYSTAGCVRRRGLRARTCGT
jgi:hypothetical protein